jgi:hypothetical protein
VPDAAQDFAFTTTGAGLVAFSLDDDADATLSNRREFIDLRTGTYTVTESVTPGWTLTDITCSAGGAADVATRTATITITAGLDVTCTYVNTQDSVGQPALGSITIIKNAVPDGAQDFAFTTTGAGLSGFSLDDDANATLSNARDFTNLAAGSYTISESVTAGWNLTSIVCSTGGTGDPATRTASISLVAGANVTCTFLNTQIESGGNLGGVAGPSRSGTLGGNPLPNTAMLPELTGSTPATLAAVLMLFGLGAGAWVTAAEARRRR